MFSTIPKWKQFEKRALKYLNENYTSYNVEFEQKGNSDSTVSDILVKSKNSIDTNFCIECKLPKSQSGQFVLLIENNQFIFSPKNKSTSNDFSNTILTYINSNFNNYKDFDIDGGRDINLPSCIFDGWIRKHYSNLNTKFILTCDSSEKIIIFPLNKLSKYFTITATLRPKGSGSRNLPEKDKSIIENFLKSEFPDSYLSISKDKKKYIANFNTKQISKNFKFKIGNYRYQLANSNSNSNIITKLSNTRNATVIFSLSFNNTCNADDLQSFVDMLSSL